MHPDFQKIFNAFISRYCPSNTVCDEGKQAYYAWLNKLDLDDTKPYGAQQKEAFIWIKPHIKLIREDQDAKYYKVEALFPLTSMNGRVYTRIELQQAVRTLIGKTSNLNHSDEGLWGVDIIDTEYESDCVELLVRIDKKAECSRGKLIDLIDRGEIVHVSIEASAVRGTEETPEGVVLKGLVFTGLGWLTKDVLPGVPLTRILPVECIVEGFTQNTEAIQMTDKSPSEKTKESLLKHITELREEIQKLGTEQEQPNEEPFDFQAAYTAILNAINTVSNKIDLLIEPDEEPSSDSDEPAEKKPTEKIREGITELLATEKPVSVYTILYSEFNRAVMQKKPKNIEGTQNEPGN